MKLLPVAIVVVCWLSISCQVETLPAEYHNDSLNSTSSTCGGNCPSGCNTCPCGTGPSAVNIRQWCARYNWNQANCECIVRHESAGNAYAQHMNRDGTYDVGLWQINQNNWSACSGGRAPCDPNSNLNCAANVYRWGGNTWRLWATCGMCNACNSA